MVFTDYYLKVVKLTNSFHSSVRTQGGNIIFFSETLQFINRSFKTADFGQTNDHLPRKAIPYILQVD